MSDSLLKINSYIYIAVVACGLKWYFKILTLTLKYSVNILQDYVGGNKYFCQSSLLLLMAALILTVQLTESQGVWIVLNTIWIMIRLRLTEWNNSIPLKTNMCRTETPPVSQQQQWNSCTSRPRLRKRCPPFSRIPKHPTIATPRQQRVKANWWCPCPNIHADTIKFQL